MWTSLESVFTGWESPRIPKGLISEDSRVQGICGRIWDDLGVHFPKSLRLQVEILQKQMPSEAKKFAQIDKDSFLQCQGGWTGLAAESYL